MFEKDMSLRQIKSYIFPMIDGEGNGAGGGGGIDADAHTGLPVQIDANAEPEEGVAGAEGPAGEADPGEGDDKNYILEIDGVKLTEEDLLSWKQAHENNADFTKRNQDRAAELNAIEKAIEEKRQGYMNPPASAPVTPQTPDKPNITADEFQDMMLNDPQKAMTFLGEYVAEQVNQTVGKVTSEAEAKSAFLGAYPDFMQTLDSAEFKAFQASNPLSQHVGEVNTYLMYKEHLAKQSIEEAGKNGFNDGEKKTIENLKAKGNIKVLGNSGARVLPNQKDFSKMSPEDVALAATKFLQDKRRQEEQ